MSNIEKPKEKIIKKAAHFNLENEEDKILIEFIRDNHINFSALSKQLIMQYRNEQLLTRKEVENLSRNITIKVLEEKLTSAALENVVRKVLLESLQNNNIILSNEIKDLKEQETVIDKAVQNYTDSDIAAMDF